MKKFVKIILLTFIVMCVVPMNVHAEEKFMDGDYIPDVYFIKEKNGQGKYRQARFLVRQSDKQFAYCIEPWLEMDSSISYQELINANTVTDEILQKITLAAYYGYGYKKHTDSRWYFITQIVIWRMADPNGNFYFTDTLNGKPTTKFDSEISELENLVNRHNLVPKLPAKRTLMLGESVGLSDSNGVLNQFSMSTSPNVAREFSNGTIQLTAIKTGVSQITFTKKDTMYRVNPIIYHSDTNQDFLTTGSFSPVTSQMEIEVVSGKITIQKKDFLTQSEVPSGDASLLGSTFELYDSNRHKIDTITLDDTLTKSFENLKKGTYYVKEVKAGDGYLVSEEEIKIVLSGSHLEETVTFFNKVMENKIKLVKYYGKEGETLLPEADASFEVYDKNDNLVQVLTTNTEGVIEVVLPYGTYRLHQTLTKENYQPVEDFEITVKEDNQTLYFEKYDYEKTGKLILIKLDQETKNPIEDNSATFEITNLTTNEKWQVKTDAFGILSLDNLSFGDYEIIEIIAPIGYQLPDEKWVIHLNQEKEILEIENEKMPVIVEVPVPDTSIFEIKGQQEYLDDKKKYYLHLSHSNTL